MIERIIGDVLSATASLVLQAGAGIYLCHLNLLDQEKLSYLSKLVEQFFTPCLIFSSFVQTLDMTKVEEWLVPMIIGCLSIIQGMAIGYFANKYIIKDRDFEAVIVLGCGLAMTTNMQLNLSHTLKDYLDSISEEMGYTSQYSGEQRAVKYIMINTFINTIMRWTLAKEVLVSLKKKYETMKLQELKHQVYQKQIEMKDLEITEQSQIQNDLNEPIIRSTVPSPQKDRSEAEKKEKEEESGWKSILKNPPIQMSILSVIVCLIPPLREVLIQEGSFLNRAIYQPSASMGHVILPLVLMTLGGNLYISYQSTKQQASSGVPADDAISKKTILSITVIRLLIMPFLGWFTLYAFEIFGQANDPVLQFITIVSNSVPSAINLLIISTLYFPKTAKEMAKVLLSGYSTNIITLPIVLAIFFNQYQSES